jgi:hypothetical protein
MTRPARRRGKPCHNFVAAWTVLWTSPSAVRAWTAKSSCVQGMIDGLEAEHGM